MMEADFTAAAEVSRSEPAASALEILHLVDASFNSNGFACSICHHRDALSQAAAASAASMCALSQRRSLISNLIVFTKRIIKLYSTCK